MVKFDIRIRLVPLWNLRHNPVLKMHIVDMNISDEEIVKAQMLPSHIPTLCKKKLVPMLGQVSGTTPTCPACKTALGAMVDPYSKNSRGELSEELAAGIMTSNEVRGNHQDEIFTN